MNFENQQIDSNYDVVVIGARVAGASLAMLLARAGKRVLVIDRDPPGRDTMSTHALMRGAVLLLHRWGLLDRIEAADTPAIRQTTFHYNEEAFPVYIKERSGVDALYSPRRYVVDAIIAEAAAEAGAHVRHRTRFNSLLQDAEGRVTGVELTDPGGAIIKVRSGLVVGADGINSRVAEACGSEILQTAGERSGVVYSYWKGLPMDGTHWFYGDHAAAGAIPTNDGTCVFTSFRPERMTGKRPADLQHLFFEVLREVNPDFAAYLRHGELDGRFIPFEGRKGFIRQAKGPGWALIGDAACFKDPITAHGMTDALRDASELARAIISDRPESWENWESGHYHFARQFLELSDRIAAYDLPIEELQQLHKQLSKLMNEECDYIEREESVMDSTAAPDAVLVNG